MARDMTPVLKRCRSLDLDPVYLGIDKKSKRNARTGKKLSEYGHVAGCGYFRWKSHVRCTTFKF